MNALDGSPGNKSCNVAVSYEQLIKIASPICQQRRISPHHAGGHAHGSGLNAPPTGRWLDENDKA